MESTFSTLTSGLLDYVVVMAQSNFSLAVFAIWIVAGAVIFAGLFILANKIGVPQQFSVWTLVVPGALLCATAAGVFGSQCGLIPPVLYAGMITAMYFLVD